jgi:LysM repeat protein
MKVFFRLLLFFFFISNTIFSQQNTIKHTVLKGETIAQIAQVYKTTPTEIYKLNPEAQNGIVENQIITISSGLTPESPTITHVVAPKETLYGLATQYGVKVEDIKASNETTLAKGLQVGQEINIPQKTALKITSTSKSTHLVQSKESLFSIARLYNVSVEDLDKENAELIKDGLQVGQEIKIPNKKKTLDGRVRVINNETVFYIVKAKETKYAIAKQFGITVAQLESQNPEIINGLIEGNRLAINVKEVKPSNENEELMMALAEKQVVVEKSKADTKEINALKEKLVLQEEINKKVVNVNGLLIDLKQIENTKEGSAEKLKMVLEANKNIQEILLVKLDSLVSTMNKDLVELKNTELVDLDESIRLQNISNENIRKTNELSIQLKKQLADNRKVYTGLMDKAERIVVEENQAYKKSIRDNSKNIKTTEKVEKITTKELSNMEVEQKVRDLKNMRLITRLDSLNNESKAELRLHISKASFYSKQARSFDDNLAKVKNQSYQNKAYESQTTEAKAQKGITISQIKNELAKQSSKVKLIKVQTLDNLKTVEEGFYVVAGVFVEASERDAFFRRLTDAGSLDANFFYDINSMSYDVYSKMAKTLEEAQYEVITKEGKPLFEKLYIVHIIPEVIVKE